MSTASKSLFSDEAGGSQARKIRLKQNVAGMLDRRAEGSVNVAMGVWDGTEAKMLIALALACSVETCDGWELFNATDLRTSDAAVPTCTASNINYIILRTVFAGGIWGGEFDLLNICHDPPQKVNKCKCKETGPRRGVHLSFYGRWVRRWIGHWVCVHGQCDARPTVFFPTAEPLWPRVPEVQRHKLFGVVIWQCTGRESNQRPRDH